jgi:hypothetical protein
MLAPAADLVVTWVWDCIQANGYISIIRLCVNQSAVSTMVRYVEGEGMVIICLRKS